MPKRIHPLAQYVLWLASSVAAFSVYAFTVVPVIEDGSIEQAEKPQYTPLPAPERKQAILHLFPRDSWEQQSCKVLETSQGTVLFKDYQPYDDGRVEVFPFTMVIRADSLNGDSNKPIEKNAGQPVVLRSSQKAVLQFERAFKIDGSDPGRILNGKLAGQVSIYRPPSAPGNDDFLKVVTSNVHLEKHKIYTVDNVDFEFGANRGQGRNLSIELSHATPLHAINTDFSKINGVRSLKLGQLSRMRLHPSETKSASNPILSARKSPIEFRCQGPFVFDFDKQQATFEKSVNVRQLDNSLQTLDCNQLTLLFHSKVKEDAPLSKDTRTNVASDLQLRKLIASGSVALDAPKRKASVRADHLDYDIVSNHIIAQSQSSVVFQMDGQKLTGREINYRVRSDGAIGPLMVKGAGTIERQNGKANFSASWAHSLLIESMDTSLKRVTLNGDSNLTLNQSTSIDGQDMQILLWELPKADLETNHSSKSRWEYLPAKLETKGQVVVNSDRISGTTSHLTLTWPSPQTMNPATQISQHFVQKIPLETYQELNRQEFTPQTQLIPVQRNPVIRDFEVRPTQFMQDVEVNRQNQFLFEGNTVEVEFTGYEQDAQIKELIIEGDVVVQEQLKDNNADPVQISGDQLYLIPQSQNSYRMNVTGNANVIGNGIKLTGPDVHLDQDANRLWVIGSGTLEMEQTNSKNDETPQTISVSWAGGMIFDGSKMYFEEDVACSGKQKRQDGIGSDIRSLSAGLSVMLSDSINFQQIKKDGESGVGKIDIRELILVEKIANDKRVFTKLEDVDLQPVKRPVVLEKTDIDQAGNVQARQKLIVPYATLFAKSGEMSASGPGTMMNWQVSQQGDRASIPLAQPNDIGQKADAKTFLRINFDQSLTANTQKGSARIDGKVRAIYTPVDDFEQQFDPDKPTRPGGSVKLVCDQLEMGRWQDRGSIKPTNKLAAVGNARIVGDQFSSTADRLTYDEFLDQLIVHSSSREGAYLSFVDPKTKSRRELNAGKIMYVPSSGFTKIENVREASMDQSGSLFNNR